MHVTILLAKEAAPDSRIVKQAHSLVQSGYKVHVLAWDRLHRQESIRSFSGIPTTHIRGLKSPPKQGFKQLLKLPVFWFSALRYLAIQRPDVIQCCDVDTLPIGLIAKWFFGTRIVYDAREDFAGTLGSRFPEWFRKFVRWMEAVCVHRTDGKMAASRWVAERLISLGIRDVRTVPNYASAVDFLAVSASQVEDLRRALGFASNDTVIAYIGGLYPSRVLAPLIEAVDGLPGVGLMIVGGGPQETALRQLAAGKANIVMTGAVPLEEVPLYTCAADVTYYGVIDAPYNSPNALYNSLAAKKPIIAIDSGDLGRVVREYECGVLLQDLACGVISAAIREVAGNPDKLMRLKAGAVTAGNSLNWSIAEGEMLRVFADAVSLNRLAPGCDMGRGPSASGG